tara:strand:+ start:776 stop:925 length:150 start_codon:yes stop_codon:yes gene_type:complete
MKLDFMIFRYIHGPLYSWTVIFMASFILYRSINQYFNQHFNNAVVYLDS